MGGGKKIAVVVVLLAVIVAAIAFTMKRQMGEPTPPEWVTDRIVERIDLETNEVISMTVAEWAKLGAKEGLFKNPKTKKYTVDSIWTDPETGEKMPYRKSPQYAEDREREAAAREREAAAREREAGAVR